MVSEVEVLGHVDNVVLVVLVLSAQRVQNLHLNQRLVMKPDKQINSIRKIHESVLSAPTRTWSF